MLPLFSLLLCRGAGARLPCLLELSAHQLFRTWTCRVPSARERFSRVLPVISRQTNLYYRRSLNLVITCQMLSRKRSPTLRLSFDQGYRDSDELMKVSVGK